MHLEALRLQKLLTPWLPDCGVEASPEMDDPAQQENPENPSEDKEEDGGQQAALKELSQSGDEEARQGGDYVTRGALSIAHG